MDKLELPYIFKAQLEYIRIHSQFSEMIELTNRKIGKSTNWEEFNMKIKDEMNEIKENLHQVSYEISAYKRYQEFVPIEE